MDSALDTLKANIAQWTGDCDRTETRVPGLSLYRKTAPTEPGSGMYEPSVCLVAQGAKLVQLGNETLVYDEKHYLITSMHLPTVVQVTSASPGKPYLGLSLRLDRKNIAQLMLDDNLPASRIRVSARGMATGIITEAMLDAFNRLIDLLREPESIPVLSPLIQREIMYRLLTGDQGARLRQVAVTGSHSHQIAQAIDWLNVHFNKPLVVSELAGISGMSASTFHHHFREMTAMSPLQYQKWLRLHEARRLMLAERLDASSAAFEVGYESPSQFSREYTRHFGVPPRKDVNTIREMEVVEDV